MRSYNVSILLSNSNPTFERDAQEKLTEANKHRGLKNEYKINKNILVVKFKDSLIEIPQLYCNLRNDMGIVA